MCCPRRLEPSTVEKQRGGRQPSGGLQALTAFQITISGHAWRLARCRHLQPSLSPHSVSFYFRSGLKSNIDSYAQHFKCEVSPPSTLVPGHSPGVKACNSFLHDLPQTSICMCKHINRKVDLVRSFSRYINEFVVNTLF